MGLNSNIVELRNQTLNCRWLRNILVATLAISILPSFTALSAQISSTFPAVGSYLGPLNLLKLGLPLAVLWVWAISERFDRRWVVLVFVLLGIGSAFSALAWLRCDKNPTILREWFVLISGVLWAVVFVTLPARDRLLCAVSWVAILFAAAALEVLSPSSVNWVTRHFFDPSRVSMLLVDGKRVSNPLMGVWDQGSLGKLMAITPWLLGWAYFSKNDNESIGVRLAAVFSGVWLLAVLVMLASAQRGPWLGFGLGCCFFLIHLMKVTRSWMPLKVGIGFLFAVGSVSLMVLPKDILIPRVKSLLFVKDESKYGKFSDYTRDERFRIHRLSWDTIRENPMGKACIPYEVYQQYELGSLYHSHNLLLEQYRSKGWMWGSIHLLAWLISLVALWRSSSTSTSFAFGGVICAMGLGIVDHPWFVLNQAVLLAALLIIGLKHVWKRYENSLAG